jgi:hypothetical protein
MKKIMKELAEMRALSSVSLERPLSRKECDRFMELGSKYLRVKKVM